MRSWRAAMSRLCIWEMPKAERSCAPRAAGVIPGVLLVLLGLWMGTRRALVLGYRCPKPVHKSTQLLAPGFGGWTSARSLD